MLRTENFIVAPVGRTAATALALVALAGTGAVAQESDPTVTVSQKAGSTVYWVMPGTRELSEETFGTMENPKSTLQPVLEKAQQAADAGEGPPSVPQLLQDFPFLVAVPEQARKEGPNGGMIVEQTGFSDSGRVIQGNFTSEMWNNVDTDPPGPPGKTDDRATMEAEFTDPAGNEYRAVLDHVVKPPFPGYETGGGVVVDTTLHGTTGTGSPLMPEVDTMAAWWGVGEIYVNGELAEKSRVMHLMTTEVVRNKDYELASQSDLPLPPEERFIADQEHHTHLFLLPVKATDKGPVFSPAPTAFELPNGQNQPFVHIMFEEDTLDKRQSN